MSHQTTDSDALRDLVTSGYQFKTDAILLGTAMYEQQALHQCHVKVPLKTLNRHGLIAGATGTGKTKTLQLMAESLSHHGVPVLMMDIKGDLSGIAAEGSSNPKIEERHQMIGVPWKSATVPVEFLSISEESGVRMRATISEFGPVLLSRILGLNDTQGGLLSLVFKYCDDNGLLLLDIKDLKSAVQYIATEAANEIALEYGLVSKSSAGAIMRKLLELEQQGADLFFGEPSFEVNDLCSTKDGKGMVNILRLTDIQDRPKLFSTFMLCLLAEVYEQFPEQGDSDKPRLAIFLDEAHLIFKEAGPALLDQLEQVIKLIRSKGIAVFFITQNPADIPDAILGQLGMKIQHALRAFTAKDRKAIKLAAENFPESAFYQTDQLLTQMGIGEALVTVLNEKGIPTPLVHTLLCAPSGRMDVLTPQEISRINERSALIKKYSGHPDRYSAYEMLADKMRRSQQDDKTLPGRTIEPRTVQRPKPREKGVIETIAGHSLTRVILREVARGILGVLGLGGSRRSASRRK